MHFSVRNYFIEFSTRFEGRVNHLYLDIKGLVTLGIGNLFDIEQADDAAALMRVMDELTALPFVYKEGKTNAGQPATRAEIEAEWRTVKAKQEWRNVERHIEKFKGLTDLRLPDHSIDQLVLTKLDAMERELKNIPAFDQFEHWPANAQLGLLSMAWAVGVPKIRQRWVRFQDACRQEDFDGAARECDIASADNPGVFPRNLANRDAFHNAAAVIAAEDRNFVSDLLVRSRLHYPRLLMKPMTIRG